MPPRYLGPDDGDGDLLPIMQSDIQLQKRILSLIIDAKYCSRTTQMRFDKYTIHSNNLYQIFTYVKNRGINLIKANVRYRVCYCMLKQMNRFSQIIFTRFMEIQISVRTLDLDRPFKEIEEQLDLIVLFHFGEMTKSKTPTNTYR